MITRWLVALLFALGISLGGVFAANDETEEPTDPDAPVTQPAEPADPVDPDAPDADDPVGDPTPPDPADPDAPDAPDAEEPFATDDFFTTLTANPELSTFAQAFQTAGVEQQLDPMQEWTVFAPADSVVFDATAFDTPEAFYTYIVQGAYSYDELWEMAEGQGGSATLTTVHGEEINVEIIDDTLLVAGVAQITEQDIQAANGYVHVIDAVIQPIAPAGGAGG